MTAWPDKPFIRIIRGTEYGEPIQGSLAIREEPESRYLLVSGPRVNNSVDPVCTRTDAIDEWEEVVPVPAADLERLRDEFRGSTLSERPLSALLQVTSHVKPPAASPPLDRAVDLVEILLSGSMTLSDTSCEGYLALLLDAISDFQGLERGPANPEKELALARIVRLSVEWIAETRSSGNSDARREVLEALDETLGRVESDPAVGGFAAMASHAGDAAARVDEARETAEGAETAGCGGSRANPLHRALCIVPAGRVFRGRRVSWT